MDVHLVGGFLGSGKTTTIIAAAKQLLHAGQRVGVVTNDQGKYLVDTAFVSLHDIPTVEVTGGCFCCNYDELDERLAVLETTARPDVIFAESVGSCADLITTVLKPLQQLRQTPLARTTLSVFTDSRLLRRRLLGLPLLFSDDVCYIFDKQIEEARMLVLNKLDLLSTEEQHELEALVRQNFPNKTLHFQIALHAPHISAWLKLLAEQPLAMAETPLKIDYARYGAGEAQLAWFDAEMQIAFPEGKGTSAAVLIIDAIIGAIREQGWPVGHVKFLSPAFERKLSFVTLTESHWQTEIPLITGTQMTLLLNARVEADAQELQARIQQTVSELSRQGKITCEFSAVSAFHPGFPRPIHRFL
jgi:Ni2+-binding GTPase involved in maturation of urease and hydrogenase